MADINKQEVTPQQLLARSLELLEYVQQKLGMFENQRYWSIRHKAKQLGFIRLDEDGNVVPNS